MNSVVSKLYESYFRDITIIVKKEMKERKEKRQITLEICKINKCQKPVCRMAPKTEFN